MVFFLLQCPKLNLSLKQSTGNRLFKTADLFSLMISITSIHSHFHAVNSSNLLLANLHNWNRHDRNSCFLAVEGQRLRK